MGDRCCAVNGPTGKRGGEGQLSWQANANFVPKAEMAGLVKRTFRKEQAKKRGASLPAKRDSRVQGLPYVTD